MLRVIGDVHGKISRVYTDKYYLAPEASGRTYLSVIDGCEATLQIGDMGWREPLKPLYDLGVDPDKHKVILGNHDDYDNRIPQQLGDFGVLSHGGITFGFIRGAETPKFARDELEYPKTWWRQEQLDLDVMQLALDFFENYKGVLDFMVTHTAPSSVLHPDLGLTPKESLDWDSNMTIRLLDFVFKSARIKTWIFGHFHKDWRINYEGTNFICLNELRYLDIQDDGSYGETI